MAVDVKYGQIFVRSDVEALLAQWGAGGELDATAEVLRASGHNFRFGADEPVVVLRAQDRFVPKLLDLYHHLCALAGVSPDHLRAIMGSRSRILAWQKSHGSKLPTTSPGEAEAVRPAVTARDGAGRSLPALVGQQG